MKRSLILSIATLAIVAVSPAMAQTSKTGGSAANAGAPVSAEPSIIILVQKPTFPFTTCVACNKTLPSTPVEYVKSGRLFRLDSAACQTAVDANFTAFAKKIDDAVIAQQKPTYPLTTSALSGKKLDPSSIDHVFGTRLIRLADAAEVASFDTDPSLGTRKLNEAYIAMQLPTYPYKKDPVNKEDLAGKTPVKYLWGNKLILFTSSDSIPKFETTPDTFLTLLETMK